MKSDRWLSLLGPAVTRGTDQVRHFIAKFLFTRRRCVLFLMTAKFCGVYQAGTTPSGSKIFPTVILEKEQRPLRYLLPSAHGSHAREDPKLDKIMPSVPKLQHSDAAGASWRDAVLHEKDYVNSR